MYGYCHDGVVLIVILEMHMTGISEYDAHRCSTMTQPKCTNDRIRRSLLAAVSSGINSGDEHQIVLADSHASMQWA